MRKQAKYQLRPALVSSCSPLRYLTLILGSLFVTRALGSMCSGAPSLPTLGDLLVWESAPPVPLGDQGSLKPRDRGVSLGAECAGEAPAAALLPGAAS